VKKSRRKGLLKTTDRDVPPATLPRCLALLLFAAGLLLPGEPGLARAQATASPNLPTSSPVPPLALRAALLYERSETVTFLPTPPPTHLAETWGADTSFVAHPSDPWLGFDKVQHLTFSFLWTLGSQYILVNKLDWSEDDALPLSIGSSALVGLSKELYDWRVGPTRYFSKRDLIADGCGILLAVGLILL
jgi:uncharacterized protein YfiM (DUF2279 family)